MKECSDCKLTKNLSDMAIHHKKDDKIFYRNRCLICQKFFDQKRYNKEKRKDYYKKNKELNNEYSRNWSLNNKERKKELNSRRNTPENKLKYSTSKKKWRENNKDKEKEYEKRRYSNRTPLKKLANNLRNSIRLYLKNKGFIKKSKTEKILGCSFEEFKIHLESQFEEWMTWDNWGKFNGEFNYGWDIDHIIPISSAKDESDTVTLCNYKNLRPLCSKINRHIKRDNQSNLDSH